MQSLCYPIFYPILHGVWPVLDQQHLTLLTVRLVHFTSAVYLSYIYLSSYKKPTFLFNSELYFGL
jgi:hypothetical protein